MAEVESVRQDHPREPVHPSPSAALATWLVDQLVERGLTDAVLCPGSRNAPLSFALLADPRITLHTRIDERTAAFVALGLAKVTHRPTAIVTTSGTAAANLHPAVLEAAHAGVTLVAVTADRPARMRRTGANQTTDQVRLFGDAASFVDLTEPDDDALASAWHPGGPIQLNIQLDDPLLPIPVVPCIRTHRHADGAGSECMGLSVAARRNDADPVQLPSGKRTVVVAGDDAGPPRATAGGAGGVAAPGRAEQRVPHRARTRSAPTGCCSAPTSGPASSGSSCSATRRSRGPSSSCWPARTSRWSR